ncbi:hypothetical protein SK128_018487 [Halocaridina rubra]|uniref:Uncharacterized protein n=1 Tax=Halocaridina rubra TaxID=373956 RepID=A0AAN9A5E7_HALRR
MDEQESHKEGSPCPSSSSSGGGSSSGHSNHSDVLTAQLLLKKKDKRYAAKYLRDECLSALSSQDVHAPPAKVLPELLDLLLNPAMGIKERDTIDWLKWLMAAGRTPDDFFNTGTVCIQSESCGVCFKVAEKGALVSGKPWSLCKRSEYTDV